MNRVSILLIGFFMYGCGGGDGSPQPTPKAILQPVPVEKPNVLFIISDDIGLDSSAQYPFSLDLPATPTLDALEANGLTFDAVECSWMRRQVM